MVIGRFRRATLVTVSGLFALIISSHANAAAGDDPAQLSAARPRAW